ncbi:MAG: leucyl aminopeptidase [Gemmatimonadetes bacterium]|nr:leucyl aminopeptidase [Gemmatimonadota bacterium]
MDVRVVASDAAGRHATPLLVLPVLGGGEGQVLTPELTGALADAVRHAREDLRPAEGATVVVNTGLDGGPRRVAFIGMGAAASLTAEGVRRFVGRAVRTAEERRLQALSVHLETLGDVDAVTLARAATEGGTLAAWRFLELKTEVGRGPDAEPPAPEVEGLDLLLPGAGRDASDEGVGVGRAVAAGQLFARTLQNRPGNVATPAHLGEEAERMAGEVGLHVEVFEPKRIRKERMHALLAVNQGSDEEARFIVLRHDGGRKGDPPLVLVGKGLTFDTGGVSIKPAKGMEEMKYDMSGGAAVLGAMRAVAELDLPLNVVGLVPSTENTISGKALKPGDVIRTRAGKSVEVVNTDAEGRLILADALDYGQELKPAAMVDLATLTGAVVIALGSHAAAVLGTDEGLIEELREAGERAGERCWPLPLWDEYRKQLDSDAADFMNVGGRPAGTITAAAFLREFVGDVPWGHLDIAGTAYGQEPLPYQRKGGFGFPVRLLVEWVRSRAR